MLAKIATHIRAERLKKGGIEFTNEEIQFTFDAHGRVVGLKKKEVLFTMQMIEECMLLANTAVAEQLKKAVEQHRLPLGVYRVHDGPKGEKLQFLRTMLSTLRIPLHVHNGRVTSKDLKAVLNEAKKRGIETLAQMLLLRSMGKAEYVTKNTGHFGLGFKAYTHFTSPIRRYADVMVHRLLATYLSRSKLLHAEARSYAKLVTHATEQEINAQEAERDSIKAAQCAFLEKHVGKTCTGVITGVMPFGIFVRDNDTLAEGFIHVRSLPEYLTHHEATRTLRGQSTQYRLGDAIRFAIKKVDTEMSRIDCELA
jgi:VacB/RNase II family 3'-5' exoribonuclease